MAFVDGKLVVAGLSNEEFASKLRTVPYPFAAVDAGTSVEIYHGNHGQFETRSPVISFVPYKLNNTEHLIAGYTCTPLVKFPVSSLAPGAKVMGTTIAELGNRNRPTDMIVYKKDGKDYLLIANTSRGVMKVATDGFATAPGITAESRPKPAASASSRWRASRASSSSTSSTRSARSCSRAPKAARCRFRPSPFRRFTRSTGANEVHGPLLAERFAERESRVRCCSRPPFLLPPAAVRALRRLHGGVRIRRRRPASSSTLKPTPSTSRACRPRRCRACRAATLVRRGLAGAAARLGEGRPAPQRALRRPAVAGKYAVADRALRFTPMFPFDEGRQYRRRPRRRPAARGARQAPWRAQPIAAVVGRPAVARSPSTVVTHVYPSGDIVPANQLRHVPALLGADGLAERLRLRHAARRSRPGSRRTRSCRSTRISGTTIARATRCSSIRAASSAASCQTSRWAARSRPAGATRCSSSASGGMATACRSRKSSGTSSAPAPAIERALVDGGVEGDARRRPARGSRSR